MKNILVGLLLLLSAAKSFALDVPAGGDALGHQLRGSKSVVIAQLIDGKDALQLRTSAVLLGQAPSTLVLEQDDYVRSAALRAGDYFLVFLGVGAKGEAVLNASRYSIVPASPNDGPALKQAVSDYLQTQRDPAAFRKVGLTLLSSPIPYLQYSAATDLSRRGLFSANDVDLLGKLGLARATHAEVRKLAFRQLGELKAKAYADALGDVLGNPEEPTSVRMAALDGLSFMGMTDVLRRQGASVGESSSPKLKSRYMEAIGAL